eukprot:8918400-Pyramimonas_sp.AAC.1
MKVVALRVVDWVLEKGARAPEEKLSCMLTGPRWTDRDGFDLFARLMSQILQPREAEVRRDAALPPDSGGARAQRNS